jgi:putative flavoprotein involved in K+ transport
VTGFRADAGWLDAPGAVVDGAPAHTRGVGPVPGLVFLVLPWQHTRGSALLGFVGEDAAWLADRMAAGRRADPDPEPLAALR